MKITYQLIFMIFLLAGISLGVSSCKEDEATENEWNATYVYIQRNDYLILNNSTFTLKHSPVGVIGNVEITFKLKIQKPAAEDITGILQLSGTGDIPVSSFNLSTDSPVVKAGETESEDIVLSLSDKEALAQIHDLVSGEFKIQLVNLQTANSNTMISTNSALSAIAFSVTKQEYSINNLEIGEPENSHLMDRTSWYIQVEPGSQGNASNLIDGNAYSDVAQDKCRVLGYNRFPDSKNGHRYSYKSLGRCLLSDSNRIIHLRQWLRMENNGNYRCTRSYTKD